MSDTHGPEGRQPSEKEIAEAALNLLRKDRDLNDDIYTPPGAIGLNVDPEREIAEGEEQSDL